MIPLLFKVRRSIITLIHNSVCDMLILSLEPTLANKLKDEFNFSTSKISLYFALFFLGWTMGSLLAILVPESFDKRKMMILASFVMAFFVFFVGPSRFFHFSNSPSLIIIGLVGGATARAII